jgi:hypothetical protein
MQTMNNNSILTGYIKQLLHDFNLPKAKWKERVEIKGGEFIDGARYMDKNAIYECRGNALSKIFDYSYGEIIPNITRNLELSGPLYDSYTHAYLGDYLRFRRDWSGVDLMSMYNCFGGDVAKNVSISANGVTFDSSDESFVLYIVPVRFGEAYTIGIDCSSSIDIVACFYYNDSVIEYKPLQNSTCVRKAGCRFANPFVYDRLLSFVPAKDGMMRERFLSLLIKVPASNASSLTVLEGDYTCGGSSMYSFCNDGYSQLPPFMAKNYATVPGKDVAKADAASAGASFARKYSSKMQLLLVNDGASYPFADKLMGYLLGNVIAPDDTVPDNIRRLQKVLSSDQASGYKWPRTPGFWEPELRDFVYDRASSKDKYRLASSLDFIGYVDRDVEASYGAGICYDIGVHNVGGGGGTK